MDCEVIFFSRQEAYNSNPIAFLYLISSLLSGCRRCVRVFPVISSRFSLDLSDFRWLLPSGSKNRTKLFRSERKGSIEVVGIRYISKGTFSTLLYVVLSLLANYMNGNSALGSVQLPLPYSPARIITSGVKSNNLLISIFAQPCSGFNMLLMRTVHKLARKCNRSGSSCR